MLRVALDKAQPQGGLGQPLHLQSVHSEVAFLNCSMYTRWSQVLSNIGVIDTWDPSQQKNTRRRFFVCHCGGGGGRGRGQRTVRRDVLARGERRADVDSEAARGAGAALELESDVGGEQSGRVHHCIGAVYRG